MKRSKDQKTREKSRNGPKKKYNEDFLLRFTQQVINPLNIKKKLVCD